MKTLIFSCLLSACLFSSCAYRQLCYISPGPGINGEDSAYVFENDTVKITYGFWNEQGVLAFSIYNKLAAPVYIDWKKSSYVLNGEKMNYWTDQTVSTAYGIALGTQLYKWYGLSSSITNATTTRPERITFLAPHSSVVKASSYLWSSAAYRLPQNAKSGEINKPDFGKVKGKLVTYAEHNSPIKVRNFLTYSITEAFSQELYIDNSFYLSKIFEMKDKDFRGTAYYDKQKGKEVWSRPFFSPKQFYLKP